jgi:uncharacterized protein YndB with AHSA1/START domain
VIVQASIDRVWEAWTTVEGVKSFFAPDPTVDLKIGGSYEMYFDLKAAAGFKGGEGLRSELSST